jgi:tetratricopeptide (TPR) repeat protein
MEEKLLSEDEEELYGFKLKTDPLQDDAGELQASEDDFFVRNDSPEDEGEEEKAEFEFPEATEDDESLVMLTPEQAKKVVKKRAEKAQKAKELFQKLMEEGNAALEQKNYEKARESFTQANELQPDDLELNIGYMRAYSEDFTALDDAETLRDAYEQCYASAGEPFAVQIKERFGEVLQAALKTVSEKEEIARRKFEAAQEDRREGYTARVNKWGGKLLWTGIPCLAFGVAAVIFLSLIDAVQGNIFFILTLVCGGVALLTFGAVMLFCNRYLNARRLQTENEKLTSTKDGRALAELQDTVEFLENCLQ